MDQKEFEQRRNKLMSQMKDNSIAIVFSGVGKIASEDENYPFCVNRNFYYLTGIKQENSSLLLVKTDVETKSYLFIDEYSEIKEKWTGKRITINCAKEISGINNVLFNNSFESKIDACLGQDIYGEVETVYLDLSNELKIGDGKYSKEYKENLETNYHNVEIENLYPMVVDQRMVKSPAEIEEIKEAIKTTSLAISRVFKEAKPGIYEYNLRNIFDFTVFEDQKKELAFPTIISTGTNACILHYPDAADKIENNNLVLIDCGASSSLYCADITRTFPANGVFSSMQRKIYDIVLGCNKAVISYAKPGLTLKELQDFALNYLTGECMSSGLISKKEDIIKYYYHSVSHHLGLDTHDVCDRARPLEPNMVITVEPGLYFKELGIGIRVEDDVLITESGSEVLSKDITKDPSVIEHSLSLK